MANPSQAIGICKNCPAYDPFDYTNAKDPPKVPRGRCRFNEPQVGDPSFTQFFPIVEETEWCLPGRGLMIQAHMAQNPAPTPVRTYDEL